MADWLSRIFAALLVVAAVGTTAAAAIIGLHDWAGQPPTAFPSVAIFANKHAPIGSFLPADDPSIDFYPALHDAHHPSLVGMFRVNPIALEANDGKAKIALLLPKKSIFFPGAPQGDGLLVSVDLKAGPATKGPSPFTCDKALVTADVVDARRAAKLSHGDLFWSIECHSYGTLIWTHLPAKTAGHRGTIESGNQHVDTDTAAQIKFQLPDYDGLVREDFSNWNFTASLATHPNIPGQKVMSIDDLLGESASPVIALHTAGFATVDSLSPAGSESRVMTYLSQRATIWRVKLNGEVDDFNAVITVDSYQKWASAFGFLSPLFLGVFVTAGATWATQRLRGEGSGGGLH